MTNLDNRTVRFLLLATAFLFLYFAPPAALADVGPKPTMNFELVYQIDQPVPIINSQMLECEDAACAQSRPLEEMGPQRFECSDTGCFSMSYGYRPYHKLVLEFADKTRESNIFPTRTYNEQFQIIVRESDLQVVSGAWSFSNFLLALLVTLVIETLIAALYRLIFRLPKSVLWWVPVASLLSLPVVWFVIPRLLLLPAGMIMCLYELFAVLFEAVFLYLVNRKQGLKLIHAVALSLIMNFFSFIAGWFFIG